MMHDLKYSFDRFYIKMPSFFKNIKKFFGQPQSKASTNSNNSSHSAEPKTAVKKAEAVAPVIKKNDANVITEDKHHINIRHIDNNAINVVKAIQQSDFEAYLVGGCVRDLLLNKKPKDFDVTTSAHPEQAHKIFHRSRLIGRRFKLLHVRFGRDLIEVATFRASHDGSTAENQAKQNDSGLILRDNVYGTIQEDALRRDFTINALYYDVNHRCIYDFTNGYDDIANKKIRMIGNPQDRYREDPVRMLRAVRFAAKLDFEIEAETASPIKELAPLLFDIAPARLFDEVLKLFQSGQGAQVLHALQSYNLLQTLLPQTAHILTESSEAETLILNALKNTDRRIKQRKSVSPAFLFSVLLWPTVQKELTKKLQNKRIPPISALQEIASSVISEQIKRTSIPKRFTTNIREIWELQLKLTKRPGNKAESLIEHPRFRAAYDLLVLREKSGEDLKGISQWWTEYQSAPIKEKERLVAELNKKNEPAKAKRNDSAKSKKVKKDSEPKKENFEKFDVVEQVKPAKKPAAPAPQQKAAPIKIEQATNNTAEEKPQKLPKQVDETATEKAVAPAVQAAPQKRVKPRRSRAKNDPRNNR